MWEAARHGWRGGGRRRMQASQDAQLAPMHRTRAWRHATRAAAQRTAFPPMHGSACPDPHSARPQPPQPGIPALRNKLLQPASTGLSIGLCSRGRTAEHSRRQQKKKQQKETQAHLHMVSGGRQALLHLASHVAAGRDWDAQGIHSRVVEVWLLGVMKPCGISLPPTF